MTRLHPTEALVERSLSRDADRAAWEAEQAQMKARADEVIAAALFGRKPGSQRYMAIALLNAAVKAVTQHHDSARAQACLGQAAARYGAELPGAKPSARRQAERLFRKGEGAE